jgi:hypothetical protein
MHLFRLLRRGDPEGRRETEQVIREANETRKRLRDHIEKNHLSEALGLVFAPNLPSWQREKRGRR